jgi:hypothetical protein
MSAYWSGIWKNLTFNVGSQTVNYAESLNNRFSVRGDGKLEYVQNKGYEHVLVFVTKRLAIQLTKKLIDQQFSKYKNKLIDSLTGDDKLREKVQKQRAQNKKNLILAGGIVDQGLGFIDASGHTVYAKNKYGHRFPEALMIYYKSDKTIEVEDVIYSNNPAIEDEPNNFKTDIIFFIDIVASVTVQSSKNLILTQVQGRDFTRKELVSGGDLTFSVSGKITGDSPGVYPANDVRKFIQIAQYGGVIQVNHYLFKQFNVKQIIIKDYSLDASECKNVQPYSFTCVAVEPDEDVIITQDTIGVLNEKILVNSNSAWYKMILNNALDAISTSASNAVSKGLDSLVPNI